VDLTNFLAASYSQMKQTDLAVRYGMEVSRQAIDIQRKTGEWAVELMKESSPSPSQTGKGYVVDLFA
jgi:hypothetical protein